MTRWRWRVSTCTNRHCWRFGRCPRRSSARAHSWNAGTVQRSLPFLGSLYQPVHQKQFFPQEPGFFEETWFDAERSGFEVVEYNGVRVGVLLCTELMFTEWARHYRRHGAHVLVSPRASRAPAGQLDTAARMAALVSGCYVLSSNRASDRAGRGPSFGGRGFAYSPTGELLAETSEAVPFACVNIDLKQVSEAQRSYPCYVRELWEHERGRPRR